MSHLVEVADRLGHVPACGFNRNVLICLKVDTRGVLREKGVHSLLASFLLSKGVGICPITCAIMTSSQPSITCTWASLLMLHLTNVSTASPE